MKSFKAKARRAGGRVAFSSSLISSPIARALTGARYAGWQDRQAARTTSQLGR